jgi:hypothetical protein
VADVYYCEPIGPFAPAIGANFNTFTTRQDVSALPLPVIGSNRLRPGSLVKIEAEGEWSSATTPTLVLGIYAGIPGASGGGTITSILAESSAFTLSALTSIPWRLEYRGKVVTIGTAGSIVGSGDVEFGTSLTAFTGAPIPITLALRTVAINTAAALAVGICATFSASAAANNVRTYNHSVMLMN